MKFTQTLLTSVLALLLTTFTLAAQSEPITDKHISAATQVNMVDINRASEQELSQLINVGPKKAQEIIRYRQVNGPFNHINELTQVKGIGINTVEKNRSRLLAGQ